MDPAVPIDVDAVRDVIVDHARALLKCETVRPEDHYFDLGGDSMLAAALARRIEAAFGFRPGLDEVLSLSLADLAQAVCAARRQGGSRSGDA